MQSRVQEKLPKMTETFPEFKVGDFDVSLMQDTLKKEKKENVIVWEALGFAFEGKSEKPLIDASGREYYTSKSQRTFLALNEEQLVEAFNKVLRIPDFYKRINANPYKVQLSEEHQKLLIRAVNLESLEEHEVPKLNKALLYKIYQHDDGLLRWM
jgi:hypothetical protein